jgi:energy-converting hydrogenase Eha subunit C
MKYACLIGTILGLSCSGILISMRYLDLSMMCEYCSLVNFVLFLIYVIHTFIST